MAEMLQDSGSLESTTVGIYRTAATVKGGRRFSFGALVVVGDRNGSVGLGYGKANQVPPAIEKAQKEAKRKMRRFPMEATTIPHAVTGRFGSCSVRLMPASPGTGVIAGASVRAPLEMAGVQDCLTKVYGSTNPRNLVKAVIDGLEQLRAKSEIESLRGVTLDPTDVQLAIERGRAHTSETPTSDDAGDGGDAPARGRDAKPDARSKKNVRTDVKKSPPKKEEAPTPEAEAETPAAGETDEKAAVAEAPSGGVAGAPPADGDAGDAAESKD